MELSFVSKHDLMLFARLKAELTIEPILSLLTAASVMAFSAAAIFELPSYCAEPFLLDSFFLFLSLSSCFSLTVLFLEESEFSLPSGVSFFASGLASLPSFFLVSAAC